MSDEELADGLRANRVDALEELVSCFHRPVLRYLWQAGGSLEDAEDLATQTLLRVKTDIAHFRGSGSLKGWVFRIAYRQLLAHRRRQALQRLWTAPPERRESPEDAIVLHEALNRLPSDQRNAFLLTEVEGLSMEEAAEALGIPCGTVKSRTHHARQKLRQILTPTYGELNAEATHE